MAENSGLIPKEQIERVVEASDIVSTIGGYVQLKPSGKNHLGLCPFHHEKTPSFVVSALRQNYHCYGCGAHGNVIRFLMDIEHLKFPEAVRYMADRVGVAIGPARPSKVESETERTITGCLKEAFEYYRQNLFDAAKNQEILSYLKEREISDEAVETFQLGYALPEWDLLYQRLLKKKYDEEIQEKVGLIKEGKKGNHYDRLRNRLIFPIRDTMGTVLGFAGRALGDGIPKYLNPPETLLYKKSGLFYGVFEAGEAIRKTKRIILVEGYLDVIRLHENGWKESVAACGTALGDGHLRFLKKLGASEVFLLFDGDSAGFKAADRAARLFVENEVDSKIVVLPKGLDPDDYFKEHESKEFERLLELAQNDYEFLIQNLAKTTRHKGIEYQKSILDELLNMINPIQSQLKKDIFLAKVADVFQVDKKSLLKENRSFNKKERQAAKPFSGSETEPLAGMGSLTEHPTPEIRFMQYLVTQPKTIVKARQYVEPDDFDNQELKKLFTRFLHLGDGEFQSLSPDDFPEMFIEFSSLIMALIQSAKKSLTSEYSERMADQLIYPLKTQKINHALKYGNFSPTETRELVIKKQELRKRYRHLNHRDDAGKTNFEQG